MIAAGALVFGALVHPLATMAIALTGLPGLLLMPRLGADG